jgi:ABC-type sugar transport system ATPase subunit
MAGIRLDGVTKRYGSVVAVDAVDLDVRDHELLALLGPSGCGKSTVLRLIAGLEEPTAGSIFIGDRLVNDESPKDRDVAMVFQNYALYPHMSVFDNIAFGIRRRGIRGKELRAVVASTAGLLGIDQLLARKPAQLSGGQRQRVALARAIVRRPAAFLMDEPLSNLDAKLRAQTRRELAKLHEDLQTTTIYVTHDQTEAMTLGERVAIIAGGRLQQVDRPQEVYDQPANLFVAQFIGSPPMNIVPLVRADGALRVSGTDASPPPTALPAGASDNTVMGFRPEALKIGCPPRAGVFSFSAVPEATEHLGAQLNVECRLGDSSLVAVVASHEPVQIGASIPFWCDAGALHFFDSVSGRRLS